MASDRPGLNGFASSRSRLLGAVSVSVVLLLAFAPPTTSPASAQETPSVVSLSNLPSVDDDEQMLVEADELIYDNENEIITADGGVQIYYGPYTLQADRVVYDQKSQRVEAQGNVRVTEPDGNVIYAENADLSDDFRDGFIRSLTVETPDNTRVSAAAAERTSDNTTVFNKGVYTACDACEKDPTKPPLWQVKAVRIVHDQEDRMIYYENASLEFFGLPVAFFPFFSTPDPTVKRKTGFLTPGIRISDAFGAGVFVPYFINVAPNKDITLRPLITTRQGILGQAEWRHRLANGTYSVRGAGINQLRPDDSPDNPGDDREWRGYLNTRGDFAINKYWNFGWDGTVVSDDGFLKSYAISGQTWLTSTAHLTGLSERNHFEARAYAFQRLNSFDYDQSVLPTVGPSIDHDYTFDRDIFGGELSLNTSIYNTHRGDIDNSVLLRATGTGALTEEDYSHSSRIVTELQWRRKVTDALGQVYTPFASLRGDLYHVDAGFNPAHDVASVSNPALLPASYDQWQPREFESGSTARIIPTVGIEYRFPFASTQSWGTHVVEPVAQLYYRPDLHNDQNDVLNEDALSLVFDTTTLFDRDKFSGRDRVETGLRANVGLRYTATFANGGAARATFGRSFHLAGDNPFPQNSGLEDNASDYVGAAEFDLGRRFRISASTRLDSETLVIRRAEIVAAAQIGRVTTSAAYAQIRSQPGLGSRSNEQQLIARAGLKVTDNWSVSGYGRYDFDEADLHQAGVGIRYGDECFTFSLGYNETYSTNDEINRSVGITINLRTLGGVNASTSQLDVFDPDS